MSKAIETNQPVVSVIMPAYRVNEYISAAIDSVLAQTFTDYEIIVVNDGSPDTEELERVLARYDQKIVYIKQENRGCSGARNTAIRAARGRYIALLDPDDIWEPDYLEVQIGALDRDPTIDVLYPNAVIFGDLPDNGKFFMDLCPSKGKVTFKRLVTQKCNVMISVTARREAIERAGMFDESLRSSEDFDMWLRVIKNGGRIAYHRRPLVRYRRREGSLSSDPVWMCEHILQVYDKADRSFVLAPDERKALRKQMTRFRAMLSLYEGKRAFFSGDFKKAQESLSQANAFLRSSKLTLVLMLLRAAPRVLLRAYNLRDRFLRGASTTF